MARQKRYSPGPGIVLREHPIESAILLSTHYSSRLFNVNGLTIRYIAASSIGMDVNNKLHDGFLLMFFSYKLCNYNQVATMKSYESGLVGKLEPYRHVGRERRSEQ